MAASTRNIVPLLPTAAGVTSRTPPRQVIWMMSAFVSIFAVVFCL